MSIRALIADDELLARSRVREMLRTHGDVEVVGECANGGEVTAAVVHHKPDFLLLDVEMPGGNAFDALSRVPEETLPVIVFITAHSEFAIEAFEASAADYLLKPFNQERFDRAIERARRLLGRNRNPSAAPRRRGGRDRFAVKRRGEILFVRTNDIDWFEAEGNYVRIHTAGKSHLVRESLQSLDETLDPTTFLRVHRSAIVNIDRVKKIVSTRDGGTAIVLADGGPVPVGPAYRERLHEVLGDPV